MERLSGKVEILSAGTGLDLLNVSNDLVFQKREEATDTISNIVYNWMDKRPLLCSGLIEAHGLSKVRPEIQVLTPDQREREFIGLALNEALEFLVAVREGEPVSNVKLEFGDTLFSILALEDSTLTAFGDMSIETYNSDYLNEVFPNLKKTLKNLSAEESIVFAVGMVNQVAGPNDASKLVDLRESMANEDDETFEKIFAENPIIHSLNLVLDLTTRYSILKDWDLVKIIKQTARKNNKNMPEEFFGAFAPFSSISDILSCLRLFRKYVFTEERGSFKKQFTEEFFYNMRENWAIHPVGYEFRLWVNGLIEGVAKSQEVPITNRKLAEQLLNRNICSEYPLWNVSKHSFQPVNVDLKLLD